jgi:hypothetical protein
MRAWRRLRAAHRIVLVAFAAAFGAGLIASLVASQQVWIGSWRLSDRLAAVSAIASLAALYEAAMAGTLALVAYALASERPSLTAELWFRNSPMNKPVLPVDADDPSGIRFILGDYLLFTIRLRNTSAFSARNPAVRVELIGISHPHWDRPIAPRYFETTKWMAVKPVSADATVAWVWNGGVDATIHGPDWFIDLPELDLGLPGFIGRPGEAYKVFVEAVAEGDRFRHTYDITVKPLAEWIKEDPSRSKLLGRASRPEGSAPNAT